MGRAGGARAEHRAADGSYATAETCSTDDDGSDHPQLCIEEVADRIVLVALLRIRLLVSGCRDSQHQAFPAQLVAIVAIGEAMLEHQVDPLLE